MKTSKLLFASAAAGIALTGSAQAGNVKDVLFNLASTNGFAGVPAAYDFNDISLSTNLSGTTPAAPGDVIEGIFTIDSISLTTLGGTLIDTVDLSSTDVEVFGRFTLTIGAGAAVSVADFQIFEDDRVDGVRSVTVPSGLTGTTGYNSASWGGGVGVDAQGKSLFAGLDILSGGSYSLIPIGTDLAIIPDLDIAGGTILDPSLGVTGRVGGTGTISPTSTAGEFTDRASFKFNATVLPTPTAAMGGLVLAGLAAARRRRIG
ncbi:MAG: hypothetical protein RIG82_09715 [Phycisphaeraceae bacterium]